MGAGCPCAEEQPHQKKCQTSFHSYSAGVSNSSAAGCVASSGRNSRSIQREPVGRRVVLHAVGSAVLLLTEEQTVASQRDDRILHQPSVAERVVIDEHPVGCRTDAAQGGRERSLCCEPGPADAVAVELFFERGDVLHHLLTAAYVRRAEP